MAGQMCKYCGEEPAAFLISEINTGDTAFVGLLCLPPFAQTAWEDAGLPPLLFDVTPPEETIDEHTPDDLGDPDEAEAPKIEVPPAPTQEGVDADGYFDPALVPDTPPPADE